MLALFGYILIGTGVALLSSFLGFGGGTIIVPFLPLVAGFDIKTTVATSLAIVTLNAANNTFNFHRQKLVRWKLVAIMSLGSISFGFLSSKLTHFLDEQFVKTAVIIVFSFLALITYLGKERVPVFLRKKTIFNQILLGALAGMSSGLGGIGGGTFLIPILIVGHWVDNKEVSPTGNAMNMLTAGSAALTLFFSNQHIEWMAVIIILFASLVASHFARSHQHRLSEKHRRFSIVGFLVFTILIQIYGFLRS